MEKGRVVPQVIHDLISRFELHRETYTATAYNETLARRDFIDPMFKALGWDVDNSAGLAENYRQVVHEDAIKVAGHTRAPDYSFRIGGRRIFFLEAKKPSVNIKEAIEPAYQLRRYAWTAKLPVSILTDFQEFSVYDTRIKPNQNDKASTARILYIRYTEYPERWEEIESLFSPLAIQKGSLDKYMQSAKKRGTAEVDDAFLAEIEGWRDELARNIALRNKDISQRELNDAVQRTIDRIIFLRICEDRGIEEYAQLFALLNGNQTYERLKEIYRRADDRYNSGLFHFRKEKDRPGDPDNFTTKLTIDDKVLKGVIRRLYYPESPYEFSVLSADILGQVYERFLGNVIRLTTGGQARIEQKPEVRKAGGVYYTPTYIVDYIVMHTVGKLLEGKSPQEIAGCTETWKPAKNRRPLSILDPACGSGSFLLGAYQFLLDWHLYQYSKNPKKYTAGKEPKIYEHHKGGWKLTTAERKRILLANIYGVDIDPQAVEVTKLSLLLKVLEGETAQTVQSYLGFYHRHALPDLANNIKCGNSLIGPEFYNNRQLNLTQEEQYRVNAFEWSAEFEFIRSTGGFDAIIGNPPYIRIQTLNESAPDEVHYFKRTYKAAASGNYDIYVIFSEKALSLIAPEGHIGFIMPNKFFQTTYGRNLRTIISEGRNLEKIIDFGDQQVFKNATTYTCLIFLSKSPQSKLLYSRVDDLQAWQTQKLSNSQLHEFPQPEISNREWSFGVSSNSNFFEKLRTGRSTLIEIADIFVGLQTDGDRIFIVEEIERKGNKVLCHSASTQSNHWFELAHLKPLLKGSVNIRRYKLTNASRMLIFPYTDKGSTLMDPGTYARKFPLTWKYILLNRSILEKRNKGQLGSAWYGYVYKKNHSKFTLPKLLVPSIATGSAFTADLDGKYYFVGSGGGGGGGYGLVPKDRSPATALYLLAILNSSLINFYFRQTSTKFRGGYIALNKQYIEHVPIEWDMNRRPELQKLAERMLDLNACLQTTNTAHERSILQRQIATTDAEIDRLVFELYGLTEEEIGIVKAETAQQEPVADVE